MPGITDNTIQLDPETAADKGVSRIELNFTCRRDPAGDRGAAELAERLRNEGFDCYRIEFPKGMDASEYALKVTPAAKSLGVLIRKAVWLGQGKPPAIMSAPIDELAAALGRPDIMPAEPMAAEAAPESFPSSLAADADPAPAIPEPAIASPLPPAPADDAAEVKNEHEIVLLQGDRRYRVRGWKKPLNPESLKVNLLVHRGERFHVDTLDLYSAKARAGFVKQAGLELGGAGLPVAADAVDDQILEHGASFRTTGWRQTFSRPWRRDCR